MKGLVNTHPSLCVNEQPYFWIVSSGITQRSPTLWIRFKSYEQYYINIPSNLNDPGTKTHLSHSFLELSDLPFLFPLWGNKKWAPSMNTEKLTNGKISGSTGCKWSSLNEQGSEIHLSRSFLELDDFPFPIISPLG